MIGRRPHSIEPAPPVLVPRHGECGARELLGIEPVGGALGRISSLRQRTLDRLGCEVSTEPRHVPKRVAHARRLVGRADKNKRARPCWTAPAPGRGIATRPRSFRASVVDVDVDRIGNVDVRRLAAEAELAAEDEQQDEDDDDQQHNGENSATASAAAGLHDGRAFVLRPLPSLSAIGNSPCFPCYVGETNECCGRGSAKECWDENGLSSGCWLRSRHAVRSASRITDQ